MIRVLVVDDSVTVREHLIEVLEASEEFEVVGQAGDGRRAVELTAQLRPDVIALDMVMPDMTGVAATEHIMAHTPTPILVVSSSFNRGELFDTYSALAAGAVDVLEKPKAGDVDWEARFLSSLRVVSKIKVITHPRGRLGAFGRPRAATEHPTLPRIPDLTRPYEVCAIGASTGGPAALAAVLSAIGPKFPMPILMVLHIDAPFAATFADWLGHQCKLPVKLAQEGEHLDNLVGEVRLAPANVHLVVQSRRLHLTAAPPRNHCRPSVDVLFESLAHEVPRTAAALLTGMGRDGAQGLLSIRLAGGFTIAQDEATSVVYGMPREAVLIGAADHELPLPDIGPMLDGLRRARGT